MSDCNNNCSTCSKDCKDRKSFLETPKESTKIKKIIAVMSGKGGVGKSIVTSLLAVASKNLGLKTAIMDADVLGPSIPKSFGLGENERMEGDENGMYPSITKGGIKVASINLLLEEQTMPVVWRGPVVSGVVKQFYTDVLWEENDIMFIDMPPGTGDVPLTVFQSIKVDGIIAVTTPQDLVKMIVEKSVNMANMMNIPMLGIIENMSYVKCPKCGENLYVFGESKLDEISKSYSIKPLAKLPLDPTLRELVDSGNIEKADVKELEEVIKDIIKE